MQAEFDAWCKKVLADSAHLLQGVNPQPQTLNPKPSTSNPKLQNLNPNPYPPPCQIALLDQLFAVQ